MKANVPKNMTFLIAIILLRWLVIMCNYLLLQYTNFGFYWPDLLFC